MSFTTPAFLIFLAAVYWGYWRLSMRGQNWLIFAASLFFYGWWDWRFLCLPLFTSTVDYWVALRLMKCEASARRKALLLVSLISNLGLLGFFKYYNFFTGSVQDGLRTLGLGLDLPMLNIILPLGISFYTFQALSYTIDVYRRELPAVADYVAYMCFITFFPHMVAGPIQQAHHFLGQFQRPRQFDWRESVDGCRQMLWGYCKKMVIADTLARYVEAAYHNPSAASGGELLWATWFFAFQIYCDFSGYTDIAIGCAKLFNFQLTRNFAYPYFSTSIPEFWRRWHIALSSWFRRYLYIPLGGNRVGLGRMYLNVMIVFVVSGIWHGANGTFAIWGALNGLFFVCSLAWSGSKAGSHGLEFQPMPMFTCLWKMALTFNLICFTWVFFRASSVSDAFLVLHKIGGAVATLQLGSAGSLKPWELILLLLVVEWLGRNRHHAFARLPSAPVLRWAFYYAIVILIFTDAPLAYVPFIYFQF